jgi:hypothetical protein
MVSARLLSNDQCAIVLDQHAFEIMVKNIASGAEGVFLWASLVLAGCQVGCLQSEEAATWVVVGSLVGSSIGVRAQYH